LRTGRYASAIRFPLSSNDVAVKDGELLRGCGVEVADGVFVWWWPPPPPDADGARLSSSWRWGRTTRSRRLRRRPLCCVSETGFCFWMPPHALFRCQASGLTPPGYRRSIFSESAGPPVGKRTRRNLWDRRFRSRLGLHYAVAPNKTPPFFSKIITRQKVTITEKEINNAREYLPSFILDDTPRVAARIF
jgi:hypothetical protein